MVCWLTGSLLQWKECLFYNNCNGPTWSNTANNEMSDIKGSYYHATKLQHLNQFCFSLVWQTNLLHMTSLCYFIAFHLKSFLGDWLIIMWSPSLIPYLRHIPSKHNSVYQNLLAHKALTSMITVAHAVVMFTSFTDKASRAGACWPLCS